MPGPLNAGQTAPVRAITASGNGVESTQALAGTGKTRMLQALASAYSRAGYHVIAAPTARAARDLNDIPGLPARTLDASAAGAPRVFGLAGAGY